MRDIRVGPALERWALLAGLVAVGAWAGPPPFGPGEQTTYEVRVLGLPSGVAQVTVGWKMEQFGREVWPLVCVGRTSAVGALYAVNDRFVSYWDPVAEQAVGADFFIEENRFRRRDRYQYDFGAMEAIVTRQRAGQAPVELRHGIEANTLDLASAAFRLRTSALEVGQAYDMPIFTGVKLYRMRATVEAREQLDTPLGRVEAFRITLNTDFNGQMATKGLLTLFITTDARHLPVRAEAEFLLGHVRLEAVKYEPGMGFAGGR